MQKVIICKGLPASGKSSWAKKFCEENPSYVRVNRDDLRNMRGLYWLPKQEDLITAWERDTIVIALTEGYNVVVDSTNLNEKYLTNLKEFIDGGYGTVEFEEKFFNTPVDECIRRDRLRPNPVGDKVILGMYEKYLKPNVKYEHIKGLPDAIITDLDGTLAQMDGRGPFEWNKVITDKIHRHIADMVDIYYAQGFKIIIFSGRDAVCAEDTVSWLQMHEVPFHMLQMRPKGNNEKDSIIKKRMFEDFVRGKFNVHFVVDDRDQVVRMWRDELGLNCLQVNWGNF